jgi:hypothetical protein
VRAAAGDDNDDLFSFLNDQMEKEEGEENERAGGGVATGVSNDDTPEPGSKPHRPLYTLNPTTQTLPNPGTPKPYPLYPILALNLQPFTPLETLNH